MAETTDRSQGVQTGPGFAAELPLGDDAHQTYRPLSLLALGGFGLAVLTAVVVCLGGWIGVANHYPKTFFGLLLSAPAVAVLVCLLMGMHQPAKILRVAGLTFAGMLALLGLGGLLLYSNSNPWLLPLWVLFLPAAGLLVAWLARIQILTSEDTLSGLPLCNAGMIVVGVFSLVYVTYYTASVMAVRYQSAAFADLWLDRLKKGELDPAFLMTLPPDLRPAENTDLRTNLEAYWNQPAGAGSGGMYSDFAMKDFVRLLQTGSGEAKIEPLGLLEWKYEGGKYDVRYGYRVTTPICTSVIQILVTGQEGSGPNSKGRQWYVDAKVTGLLKDAPIAFSPEGQMLAQQQTTVREFVENWFSRLYRDDDDAYLWTLPAARRAEVKGQRAILGAALGGAGRWTEPGLAAFYRGGLVEADPKTFYAGKENRTAVPDALRWAFRPGADKPDRAFINPAAVVPLVQSTAGGKRMVLDVKFLYGPDGKEYGPERKKLRMLDVDALLVLECDDASLAKNDPQWQVKQIDLLRARAVQAQSRQEKMSLPPLPPGQP